MRFLSLAGKLLRSASSLWRKPPLLKLRMESILIYHTRKNEKHVTHKVANIYVESVDIFTISYDYAITAVVAPQPLVIVSSSNSTKQSTSAFLQRPKSTPCTSNAALREPSLASRSFSQCARASHNGFVLGGLVIISTAVVQYVNRMPLLSLICHTMDCDLRLDMLMPDDIEPDFSTQLDRVSFAKCRVVAMTCGTLPSLNQDAASIHTSSRFESRKKRNEKRGKRSVGSHWDNFFKAFHTMRFGAQLQN